jgi:hypothetical protein
MRAAVVVIGLFLGVAMLYQTIVITALGRTTESATTFGRGLFAIALAILWLLGVALVFPVPLASVVLFGGAGLLAVITGLVTGITNIMLWGAAAWLLAAMSFLGWLDKRNADRRARELRHALAYPAPAFLGGGPASSVVPAPLAEPASCAFCGAAMPAGTRYCATCGAARERTADAVPPGIS